MGTFFIFTEDTRYRGSTCLLVDYAHTDIWCPGCYGDKQQARALRTQEDLVKEMRRQNELAEIALMQRDPASKPYVPYVPPARPKQNFTGGMQVEPRNK